MQVLALVPNEIEFVRFSFFVRLGRYVPRLTSDQMKLQHVQFTSLQTLWAKIKCCYTVSHFPKIKF